MSDTHDYIFASCDDRYFQEHGVEFARSCLTNGNACHLHVINPSSETTLQMLGLHEAFADRFLFSTEGADIEALEYEPKVFYAMSRFFVVNSIIKQFREQNVTPPRYLILDVDCIVRARFEFPEEDIGLFLRPDQDIMLRTAAGIVYINNTPEAAHFIDTAVSVMHRLDKTWYVDQVALWHTFEHLQSATCFRFDEQHMNWDFDDAAAPIWTGKGMRKYQNIDYINEKARYAG